MEDLNPSERLIPTSSPPCLSLGGVSVSWVLHSGLELELIGISLSLNLRRLRACDLSSHHSLPSMFGESHNQRRISETTIPQSPKTYPPGSLQDTIGFTQFFINTSIPPHSLQFITEQGSQISIDKSYSHLRWPLTT